MGADGQRPMVLRRRNDDERRGHDGPTPHTTYPRQRVPPTPPPPPAWRTQQQQQQMQERSGQPSGQPSGHMGGGGGGGGAGGTATEQREEGWTLGGISRTQRRQYKRKMERLRRTRNDGFDGDETEMEVVQDVQRGSGRDGGGRLDQADDPQNDVVTEFIAPPASRVTCAAKSQMLRARLDELQEENAEKGAIKEAEDAWRAAEQWTKVAGGPTPAKLRNEVLAERRKVERRQEAVARAAKNTAEKQKKLEEAINDLEEAERQERQITAKLEYSKSRYAYLVRQQAAEATTADEGENIQKAMDALNAEEELLPPGTRGYLGLITKLLRPMCRDRRAGRGVINETGLASGSSDIEVGSNDGEDYVDDEPEITKELLEGERKAKKELQEARRRRNVDVDEAIFKGMPMQALLDRHGTNVRRAITEHKRATERLEEARGRARERLKREEKEGERGEEGGGRQEHQTQQLQHRQQQQQRQQQRQRQRHEQDDDDEEELIPCPPPAKWRRGGEQDASSEATVDETPVQDMPPPHCQERQAQPATGDDERDEGDDMAIDDGDTAPIAGTPRSTTRRGGREGSRVRHQTWASRILETPPNHAQNATRANSRGMRRYGQADPPTTGDRVNASTVAQENIKTILADGAVEAVELARRHRAQEAAASRVARNPSQAAARAGGRAASQQPTRRADREDHTREDRSKSPRRRQRSPRAA